MLLIQRLSCRSSLLIAAVSFCLTGATIPVGTILEVRLRQSVASYSTSSGHEVQAEVIAPVQEDGTTVLPQGAVLRGRLAEVKRIGLGFRNQRASMRMEFGELQLPDGETIPVNTRLLSVDNGRESVDETGKIVGIRAVSPMGHRLAGITRNLFIWDPTLQLVIAGSTMTFLRFPEAEIHFPAGTEMLVQLTGPVELRRTYSAPLPKVAWNEEEEDELRDMVRRMTWRTVREKNRKPGDIVNLVFLGEPEWLERAFAAAGWLEVDRLTKRSGWMAFRSVAESKSYPEAPMSSMLLDEQAARFQYAKSLNSFSRRHHVRIFHQPDEWRERPALAASSTQDIAITYSFKSSKIIHVVDRNIDNERAKIINDLIYTGCIDAGQLVERPWVPRSLENYTGQTLETDGAVAVLELNPCRTPLRTLPPGDSLRVSGNWIQNRLRQLVLTVGGDLTVNNPVYQAGKGLEFLLKRARGKEDRTQPERTQAALPVTKSTELRTLPD